MSQKRGKPDGQDGDAARLTPNSPPNGRGATKKREKQTNRKDEGRDRESTIAKLHNWEKNPDKIRKVPVPLLKVTPPEYHKIAAQGNSGTAGSGKQMSARPGTPSDKSGGKAKGGGKRQ